MMVLGTSQVRPRGQVRSPLYQTVATRILRIVLLDSRVRLDGKQPALSNSSGTPSLYWLRHQEESWPWKGRRREQDEREDVENWVNPLNLEVWCLLSEKPRVIDPRWWEGFYCFPISTMRRLWDWLFVLWHCIIGSYCIVYWNAFHPQWGAICVIGTGSSWLPLN